VQKSRPTGSSNDSIQRQWHGSRVKFVPKRHRKVAAASRSRTGKYGTHKAGDAKARKDKKQNKRSNKSGGTAAAFDQGLESEEADDSDDQDANDEGEVIEEDASNQANAYANQI